MLELSLEEKIAFVEGATRQLAVYTHPFLCQVLGVEPGGASDTLVGSSVRVVRQGKGYLLTTETVLAAAKQYTSTAISQGAGQPPRAVSPGGARSDREGDLAVFDLDGDLASHWALPDDLHCSEDLLSSDFLFLQGYPQVLSQFAEPPRGLHSATLPYGAMRREDGLPTDLQKFQFALDFDPANFRTHHGDTAAWIDPRGLAGAPVWRLGATDGTSDDWSPARAALVGIVTQWRPNEKLLVASKLDGLTPLF